MPFGKHKGLDLADVPTDYLRWVRPKLQGPACAPPSRPSWLAVPQAATTSATTRPHPPGGPLAREDVRRLALEIVTGYRAAAREHHPISAATWSR